MTREDALKALDDIFNYCEEIDYSLPENERSGYKMLPDIHKIRKYIIENEIPHGEWIFTGRHNAYGGAEIECSNCHNKLMVSMSRWEVGENFCDVCGSRNKKEGELNDR